MNFKKLLFILLTIFLPGKIFSQIEILQENNLMQTIDAADTVLFDMANGIITGNTIEFPVSVNSDDTIYSLDFAMTYDHLKLDFDTIINLANYIQTYSYYNTSDSTIRFTSNSLQQYGIDTPLAKMRFTMLSGMILITDLQMILVYLNGDPCCYEFTDPLLAGINNAKEINLNFYPNPASESITINSDNYYNLDVYDLTGKLVMKNLVSTGDNRINLTKLSIGNYLLRVSNDKTAVTKYFIKL